MSREEERVAGEVVRGGGVGGEGEQVREVGEGEGGYQPSLENVKMHHSLSPATLPRLTRQASLPPFQQILL